METTIRQFQEEVRDILNQDTWFGDHGIDWLAEDSLDIEYEIKKHLGQTGMVAVVTTPELVYQGEAAKNATKQNYEEISGGWRTWDERGREITVLSAEQNQATVSGGCFGNHSMTIPIGQETTEVDGEKTYKATVTFDGDIPQTVAMSMTKDNLSGKPFDKKLTWFEAQGNAFFNTSVVPDINDFIALDFSSSTARPSSKNIAALCGTVNARVSNAQLGMFQTRGTGIYNARGSYSITATVGVFIDKNGKLATWTNTSGKSGAFGGLQSQTTAATGSRAWRFGLMTKEPDTWNAAQNTAGGNNNPTYTNTTTPLAIFGVYNGDESNECYNWYGKLYFFKLWDRLRTTRKLDLYPVLKDGNVCLYDTVSNTVIQNGYTGDTSTITWEEDADFNEIINDSSEVAFVETVKVVNKGFDATISLQIIENPTVNRGKPDKDAIATALDVGHRAVYTLSGYDTEHYNDFNPSTIKQSTVAGAGGKLLQVDCRFTSTPVL